MPPTILRCRGKVFTEPLPSNDTGIEIDTQIILWYDTDRTENDASKNSSTVACILCRGNVFTEPLPINDGGYTDTQTDGRMFMKYAVERAQVPWYIYQIP
jgi:hypothetical protein